MEKSLEEVELLEAARYFQLYLEENNISNVELTEDKLNIVVHSLEGHQTIFSLTNNLEANKEKIKEHIQKAH